MKYIKELENWEVIVAPTKKIANKLSKKFDELGLKWASGRRYTDSCRWDRHSEFTAYLPKLGEFSRVEYYKGEGFTLYTIDDLLDFKEESKCLDILLQELEENTHIEKVEDVIFWALEAYSKKEELSNGSMVAYSIVNRIKNAESGRKDSRIPEQGV